MEKTFRFKKSDWLGRSLHKKKMEMFGWKLIREAEVDAYSGKKGLALGLIFLPLALLGNTRYVDVTYGKEK